MYLCPSLFTVLCVFRDTQAWTSGVILKNKTEELLSLHFMEHEQNKCLFIGLFIKYSKNSNIVKYHYNLK